jgi:hypothetical protein
VVVVVGDTIQVVVRDPQFCAAVMTRTIEWLIIVELVGLAPVYMAIPLLRDPELDAVANTKRAVINHVPASRETEAPAAGVPSIVFDDEIATDLVADLILPIFGAVTAPVNVAPLRVA